MVDARLFGIPSRGTFVSLITISSRAKTDDAALVDIIGVIFDVFLSPQAFSGVTMCCDKESRHRGFDVVGAAARECASSERYVALVSRLKELIELTALRLRHRWGQFGNASNHPLERGVQPSIPSSETKVVLVI